MKKKVFFMIPSLSGGGAERVFVNLVKNIDKSIFDVTLIYLSDERNVYEVPNDINTINLNSGRLRNAVIKIIRLIRKEKPDLILSTLGHMNYLLILLKPFFPKKTRLIIRQTYILSMNLNNNYIKRLVQRKIISGYSKADKIICQSEAMKKDFIKVSKVNKEKVVKIYNPVDVESIASKARENVEDKFLKGVKNIFYAGRLDEVKRVPLIIDAFQKYNIKQPQSILYIMGEGPQKSELKAYIKEKGLISNVKLIGFQSNPYKWLKHADLFVMASKHEGLPNMLLEVLSLEVPVLILKHPGGTKDIMESLEIENRFVESLQIQESSFHKYRKNIYNKLNQHFGVQNIVTEYEKIFLEVLEKE